MQAQLPAYNHGGASVDDFHKLTVDVDNLISMAKDDFAANPLENGAQQRLKALLDLQNILRNQHLPADAIKLIKDQVAQLSGASRHASASAAHTFAPATLPPQPTLTQYQPSIPSAVEQFLQGHMPPPSQPVFTPPIRSPPPQQHSSPTTLPPMFAPDLMAQLLMPNPASLEPPRPSSLPQLPVRQSGPPTSLPSAFPIASQAIPENTNSLLDSLRAAGLITPTPATTAPPAAAPHQVNVSQLQKPFPRPASRHAEASQALFRREKTGVQLNGASLKL